MNPVGFTPCGVAFGALRKCYTAPCNFHSDEVAGDNFIRWYRVKPGTPIYPHLTVFTPGSDVPDSQPTGPFEQTGNGRFLRAKHNGFNYSSLPGIAVDGDAQDFRGRSPLSKHFLDGDLIAPLECVGPERLLALLELDAQPTPEAASELASIELDGDFHNAPYFGFDCFDAGRMKKDVEYVIDVTATFSNILYFPLHAGYDYKLFLELSGGFGTWHYVLSRGHDCETMVTDVDSGIVGNGTYDRVVKVPSDSTDKKYTIFVARSGFGTFTMTTHYIRLDADRFAGLELDATAATVEVLHRAAIELDAIQSTVTNELAAVELTAVEADAGVAEELAAAVEVTAIEADPNPWELIAHTKTGLGLDGGTSAAIDTTGADLLVFAVESYSGGALPSVSDSKGNTWTPTDSFTNGEIRVRIWWAQNATVGSGHTFTVSGTTVAAAGQVQAWKGSKLTDPRDVFAETHNTSGSGVAYLDNTYIVTWQPFELVVCAIGLGGGAQGGDATADDGFTVTDQSQYSSGLNEGGALAYAIKGANGTVRWSWPNSSVPVRSSLYVSFENKYF